MAENTVICPHCQGHHLPTAELPREVVVVIPCPECKELAVLFRDKVVPVNRNLMKTGTRRQRILHIAEIMTEFIDSGVLPEAQSILLGDNLPFLSTEDCTPAAPASCYEDTHPKTISDEEFLQFQQVELRAIDNAAQFKRIFG